jgi:uncharacterized protein (DUF58 family)
MPVTSTSRFLDLRALASLEHLRFSTKRRVDGTYSGRHLSRQLGGAAEFVDFREYSPGDDLRRLDWKVLARTGRLYVRLYQDETNLNCTILLDASGSMTFAGFERTRDGHGSKLEYAQYFATAISHLITCGQDQVGLAVAARKLERFMAPGSTPSHVARMHTLIQRMSTWPATNLGESLRQLFSRLSRRGVLLILSDFLCDDLEDTFAALRLFRSRHWEVIALHLVHPQEERLPAGTAFRFDGLENDGSANCSPAEISRAYEERFEAHCNAVRGMALSAGCDYRRISTAVSYLQTLGGFLVDRVG